MIDSKARTNTIKKYFYRSSAIEPQFDALESFSEDLAPAMASRKWGFIDRRGAFVIKPKFDYAFGFQDGKARVLMRDPGYIGQGDGVKVGGLTGVIDKSGQYLVEPAKTRPPQQGAAPLPPAPKTGPSEGAR